MKEQGKRTLFIGLSLFAMFVLWTVLICTVDVRAAGESGMPVGFAALNGAFHDVTGVHMALYHITDWLGLVPVFVGFLFAGLGLVQLVKRRSFLKVDADILLLGIYYLIVLGCYLAFEMIPINYRPILIEGRLEASYPSSTTLLVLSVMPTFAFQFKCRLKNEEVKKIVFVLTGLFSLFMLVGRLVSGVHWLTDIVGSVLLSMGLYFTYKGIVLRIKEV